VPGSSAWDTLLLAADNGTSVEVVTAELKLYQGVDLSFGSDSACSASSSGWTLGTTSAPACFIISLVLVVASVAAVLTSLRWMKIAAWALFVAIIFELGAWGAMISVLTTKSSLESVVCDSLNDETECTLSSSSVTGVAYLPLVASLVGLLALLAVFSVAEEASVPAENEPLIDAHADT
jgi:hypothetical protein